MSVVFQHGGAPFAFPRLGENPPSFPGPQDVPLLGLRPPLRRLLLQPPRGRLPDLHLDRPHSGRPLRLSVLYGAPHLTGLWARLTISGGRKPRRKEDARRRERGLRQARLREGSQRSKGVRRHGYSGSQSLSALPTRSHLSSLSRLSAVFPGSGPPVLSLLPPLPSLPQRRRPPLPHPGPRVPGPLPPGLQALPLPGLQPPLGPIRIRSLPGQVDSGHMGRDHLHLCAFSPNALVMIITVFLCIITHPA